jgi:RTX calcium-binding nonapeptide repeat (4 copies)
MRQRSNRVWVALLVGAAFSLVMATVAMAATIVGDDGPNTLTGTPRGDLVRAKGGDDTVSSLGGRDFVVAGDGNDAVDAGAGRDFARGGEGDDTIRGGGGGPGQRGDALHGNPGNDTVTGGAGFDLVTGNAGADNLNGGPGCDRIFAGPDDDRLAGGQGFSFRRLARAPGSAGRGAILSGQASGSAGRAGFPYRCERLHGGLGNDISSGGSGRDFMSGGQGDDVQAGGGATDKIFANRGADKSYGGDGADVLWALSRFDVTAIGDPVGDQLSGGDGRDRIKVRDGEVDVVSCGPGRDLVVTDQYDQVAADCEIRRQRDILSLDQVDDTEENRTEAPSEDEDEGSEP